MTYIKYLLTWIVSESVKEEIHSRLQGKYIFCSSQNFISVKSSHVGTFDYPEVNVVLEFWLKAYNYIPWNKCVSQNFLSDDNEFYPYSGEWPQIGEKRFKIWFKVINRHRVFSAMTRVSRVQIPAVSKFSGSANVCSELTRASWGLYEWLIIYEQPPGTA